MDLSRELEVAVAAVRSAATVCRSVQADLVNAATLEKKDRSPVTVADFASQSIVCAALAEGSSVASVVGEESAAELREPAASEQREKVVEHVRAVRGADVSAEQALDWIDLGGADPASAGGRYWTLDPIDGTKGFLRGEQYAIALGLVVEGEVVLGALGCPNLPNADGGAGVLLTAVRGEGTRARPLFSDADARQVRVSDVSTAAAARFCESVESGHSDQSQSAQIAKRLGIETPPLRMDSQAKYAGLARGDASIYLRLPTRKDYEEKIWDHAAGMIVVEEAGGRVTDIHGRRLDFSRGRTLALNKGVVATNGPIHDEVLAAVAAILGA